MRPFIPCGLPAAGWLISLPQPGSAYAYDVIRILITAFEKEETNEGVAKTISEMKDFPGVTGALSVDSDGNINSKAVVKKS